VVVAVSGDDCFRGQHGGGGDADAHLHRIRIAKTGASQRSRGFIRSLGGSRSDDDPFRFARRMLAGLRSFSEGALRRPKASSPPPRPHSPLPVITRTLLPTAALVGFALCASVAAASDIGIQPLDWSAVRGANYCAAAGHHVEHWLHYDPKETERDLDYARKININQVRVFLSRSAYDADREAFRRNLIHLARTCQARHIGLMPVVTSKREMPDEAEPYPASREWVQMLVDTIGDEPALVCWDVFNEPDYPEGPARSSHIAHARVMAALFRELDRRKPRTPITIGFAYENFMEQNADAVGVLSFHDYSPTREEIRRHIEDAFAFAAKVKKPVFNGEIGCTARANPYDVAIEEYTQARMGFYIWELMITRYWGNVHGVFYPDGSVRDPSIAAAMLGIFRNRSESIVQELPNREGWVTRTVTDGKKWLEDPSASYAHGLKLAETAANLLEANELVGMRDLPTRRVALLRQGTPNSPALRMVLADLLKQLEPYQ
jgi:hypothetical protein